MKFLPNFLKGFLIGFLFLPFEFLFFNFAPIVKAQNLREEIRSQASELREEIRGDSNCDGSRESCSRPTPERPEHRQGCEGCYNPSIPPQPTPSTSPLPSLTPSPLPSNPPVASNPPAVGGNSEVGTSENEETSVSSSTTQSSVNQLEPQVLGLSYTGSKIP